MRGEDTQQGAIFSYLMPEQRVPQDHPLRPILGMVNQALSRIDGVLAKMYAEGGRPSIAPEKLLRALLLQMLYSVRSERMLMEQMHYNLLFRWFVGLSMDDAVWDVTVFTKNRDRLLEGEVAQQFFQSVRIEEWNRMNQSFTAIAGAYTENIAETSGGLAEMLVSARVSPR